MRPHWVRFTMAAMLLGCGHSEAFTITDQRTSAPFETIVPTRLTYNPGNNYEATWTEDGRGILYLFSAVPPGRSDDRCVGILPPEGGARLWEMCETRREHVDSADSFDTVALGADGRLLYMELSTRRGSGGLSGVNQPPQTRTLWLADTAFPYQGRKLLDMSFGLNIQGIFFNRLRDPRWIDGQTFVSLVTASTGPYDSVGLGQAIVRGQITATGLTLSIIPGTQGTIAYSLAEAGSTLIIIRSGHSDIEGLPLAGGVPAVRATLPLPPSDITCRETTCLAGSNFRIWRVNLASGTNEELATRIGTPRLSPASGDVAGTNLSAIYLYKGVVP